MLRDDFQVALKEAMRSRDNNKTSTVRLILAALKDRDISVRSEGNLSGISNTEILSMLANMVKQREEAIIMYREAGRSDLADKEAAEITVIRAFMPLPLAEEEIEAAIEAAISEVGAQSLKDMGQVVSILKEKHAGQIDFREASGKIKERLA